MRFSDLEDGDWFIFYKIGPVDDQSERALHRKLVGDRSGRPIKNGKKIVNTLHEATATLDFTADDERIIKIYQ